MAPETLETMNNFTEKSDVWSFGTSSSLHVSTNPQFSICNCLFEKIFVFFEKKNNICIGILYTLAKTEIIYPKNVRA